MERLTTAFAVEVGVPGLTASSAGTGALVGRPMDADAAVVLAGLGGTAEGSRARTLESSLAEQADLVLTMERGHRSTVLERAPRSLRRTFTLREARAVLGLLRPTDLPTVTDLDERGRHLVASLARRRGDWRGSGGAKDIPDPYRGPPEVHARVSSDIAAALLPLLQALAGSEGDRHAG